MSAPTLEELLLGAMDDVLAASDEFDRKVNELREQLFPSLKEEEVSEDLWCEITAFCYHTAQERLYREMFGG